MATGRDKDLRSAMGEGAARGFIGDMLPGETLGERGTRAGKEIAKSTASGVVRGVGEGVGSVVDSLRRVTPMQYAGITAAIGIPLAVHALLTRNRKKEPKTAGLFSQILNSAYQTKPMRFVRSIPLALTATAAAVPAAVTAAKLNKSLNNPDSLGSMLIASPDQLIQKGSNAALEAADNIANKALRYPLDHPVQAAAVVGAYGLGAYALYKLLHKKPKAELKTAGLISKIIAASAPVGMGVYGAGALIAPTATGSVVGNAVGKGAALAMRGSQYAGETLTGSKHEPSLVADALNQLAPADFDARANARQYSNLSRAGIADSGVAKLIAAHPATSIAVGVGTPALALYFLLRRNRK